MKTRAKTLAKTLALLGASGHGKVVADAALLSGWDAVEFFDSAWPTKTTNGLWSVVGDDDVLLKRLNEFDGVMVSIGNCATRWQKHQELVAAGAKVVSVIHPSASVSHYASVGAGTIVVAGAVVCSDAVIGEACIINTGATVDHDCVIANAVHICPGTHLSGNVHVGHGSWVGVGSSVIQGIRIGAQVMVGAGAAVVNDVADDLTVVGNPAKPINDQTKRKA